MAKKIDRSRIDAGKVTLPKKLAFLVSEKVDYLSVTDRDGEFTVEVAAASLARLIKGRAELKQLKADQKSASTGHADALAAEKESHEATKAALAKAERRVQSLTKAAARASGSAEAPAAAPSKTTRPPKVARKPKPIAPAPAPAPEVAPADSAPAVAAEPAEASDSAEGTAPVALP